MIHKREYHGYRIFECKNCDMDAYRNGRT